MSIIDLETLAFIRGIPKIGSRVYEALDSLQRGINTMAVQGNLDPNKDPAPPPNIQAVTATGQNGVLHVAIQDQSAGLSRGAEYVIEHADNKPFQNAQIRFNGASRSFSEFIGNDTRFVRAYSTYGASSSSGHVYHGGALNPIPVSGGGSIGPPAYLASQGSGTGAAGQAGHGQGPVQTRDLSNSFDWTLQDSKAKPGLAQPTPTPAQTGALAATGQSPGSGSPTIAIPASAAVLGSSAAKTLIAAVLATAKIWIGSSGNLPVAQTPSQDVSVTSAGVFTVVGVNAASVPASASLVGTNGSRQIVAASAFGTASFAPVIQIGGSATSITFTYTATSSSTGTGTGAPVTVVINITITGWPVLPSGTITIGGLPVSAGARSIGSFAAVSGFVGLSAGVSVIPVLSGTTITLDTQGTTGVATLPAATIANGSVFAITVAYQSA